MMMQEWENPDEHNKKLARKESWLCGLFADGEVDVIEKQSILKDLISDFKKQQEPSSQ